MLCCLAHMCTHPLVRAQLTLATATDKLLLIFTLGESLGGHRGLEASMLRVPRRVHKATLLRTLSCWQHQNMPSWPVLAQLLFPKPSRPPSAYDCRSRRNHTPSSHQRRQRSRLVL